LQITILPLERCDLKF